jgi:uncharacterized protein involved in cysteine biosynthesis
VRLLKRILALLFALAAVLAGFLVAVVASLIAAFYYVINRPKMATATAGHVSYDAHDVIDISAAESRTMSRLQ